MRNSEPPKRRSSIPPASPESVRFYNEAMHPAPPPFTKHKELARFLAEDSTQTLMLFISFYLARNNVLAKSGGTKAFLRQMNSRLKRHLDGIFVELSPSSREAIHALDKKIASHSARLLAYSGQKKTENLAKAFSLARAAGKDAEGRCASPEETALIVCGVFAASAKVFQFQKERTSSDFIRLTEKISSEMSTHTLTGFLWKMADSKNSSELSTTLAEISRMQGNERKIIGILSG